MMWAFQHILPYPPQYTVVSYLAFAVGFAVILISDHFSHRKLNNAIANNIE